MARVAEAMGQSPGEAAGLLAAAEAEEARPRRWALPCGLRPAAALLLGPAAFAALASRRHLTGGALERAVGLQSERPLQRDFLVPFAPPAAPPAAAAPPAFVPPAAAVVVPPAPPAPPAPLPAPPGPAGSRKGSFLVLGDWGFDHDFHGNLQSSGCQRAIASRMLSKMQELGDVKFVINVGDSFYPGGVVDKNDWQWDTKWRDVYDPQLRSIPWYSVYGNHDYFYDRCACSNDLRECAQVNGDINNLRYFYMPNLTWFRNHPELDLEVIAMDMNQYSGFNWNSPGAPEWCLGYPALLRGQRPCHHRCWASLAGRAEASLRLFNERLAASQARNLLVFSHYPTDYFGSLPNFLESLRDPRQHVEYFGGHRHNVDDASTLGTAPNHNWLSGGGGGWGTDGGAQGFVVGEVGQDSSLRTYPVYVDAVECRG